MYFKYDFSLLQSQYESRLHPKIGIRVNEYFDLELSYMSKKKTILRI